MHPDSLLPGMYSGLQPRLQFLSKVLLTSGLKQPYTSATSSLELIEALKANTSGPHTDKYEFYGLQFLIIYT